MGVSVRGSEVEIGFKITPCSLTFLNFQIHINYISQAVIEFVGSISFNPRDIQGPKEIPGIDKVKTSFRF